MAWRRVGGPCDFDPQLRSTTSIHGFDPRPGRDRVVVAQVVAQFAGGLGVASLHLYAGRHPRDPQLADLIGELSVRSEAFRRLWADHDVPARTTGTKRLHHPLVGDLTLDFVVLAVEGDPDQNLTILTPEPASPSAEAITILASWTGRPVTEETRDAAGA
ncbi:MmyB family transcriptional regulator [Streptomyces hokutonensis]|uniref:MmyB family transcriptional regulator n=1 Tax=Streptomyces hokutonensis TaxID=1306990 RepID=UPI0033EECCE7